MKSKEELDELRGELELLNKAVAEACAKRKKWMDEHMVDFTKHAVGEVVYDRDGRCLGEIAGLYRYWGEQDDPRFDTSMAISYRFKGGDNTSRQSIFTERLMNKQQLIEHKRRELERTEARS